MVDTLNEVQTKIRESTSKKKKKCKKGRPKGGRTKKVSFCKILLVAFKTYFSVLLINEGLFF